MPVRCAGLFGQRQRPFAQRLAQLGADHPTEQLHHHHGGQVGAVLGFTSVACTVNAALADQRMQVRVHREVSASGVQRKRVRPGSESVRGQI